MANNNNFILPPIPPSAQTLLELQGNAREVVTYFTKNHPTWEFAGLAGGGSQGGALLYNEIREGRLAQRVIIKYFDSNDSEEAELEHRALTLLQGAEHIVRYVAAGIRLFGSVYGIAQEYVGHGTLDALNARLLAAREEGNDVRVPDRFLWSVFLCLIRMCVALRYPPNRGPAAAPETETIPVPDPINPNIWHHDIFGRNVLISGIIGTGEHLVAPLFKLIDFGSAQIFYPERVMEMDYFTNTPQEVIIEEEHTDDNIYEAAMIVLCLATGRYEQQSSWSAEVSDTSGTSTVETTAPRIDDSRSPELRSLLYRCTSQIIPPLDEILNICEHHVLLTSFNDYRMMPQGIYETDEYLRKFIGDMILNGDVTEEIRRRQLGNRGSMPVTVSRQPTTRVRRRVLSLAGIEE